MLQTSIQSDANGIPRLYINGKKEAPVIFYGCTLFEQRMGIVDKEFKLAAEAGIHLYSVILKMGCMPEERQENIDKMSRYLDMILKYDPEAKVLVRANVSQYGDSAAIWAEKHPGDGIRFEMDADRDESDDENIEKRMTSVFSEDWRKEAEEALRQFARFFYHHPVYGDHFLGYHLGGNESDEWFHLAYREVGNDVSPAAQRYFRQFVFEKYRGDEQALREAWGDETLTFDQVVIPSPLPGNTASSKPYPHFYYRTAAEQKYVDFNEMNNVRIADLIRGFAAAVKEETHRNTLVMCFYGYLFELCGAPQSGHMAFQELLDCPDIDGFASPCGYWDRDVGGTGQYMTVIDSVAAHGKMWFVENDIRTFLRYRREPDQPRKLEGPFYGIFSFTDLYEVWRREAGTQMVRGCASWYMDLAGEGWFYHPDYWEEIKALEELYRATLDITTPYKPELAVVVDPDDTYHVSDVRNTLGNTMFNVRTQCYRLGVSCGFYTTKDWLDGKADSAKMVLLFNPSGLRGERHAKAVEKIRRAGQTTMFMYGFGNLSEDEIRELTGMTLQEQYVDGRVTTNMLYCNEWDGFVNTSGGCAAEVNPRFYVTDGASAVWAHYSDETDKVSFATHEQDGWRTVFFGGFETSIDLLNRVTQIAGLFQYGYVGEYVLPGSQLYVTHSSFPGEKTVRFPEVCDVYDYFEDTWYLGVDHITKTMDVGKTCLYFHGKREEIEGWNLPRWTREFL